MESLSCTQETNRNCKSTILNEKKERESNRHRPFPPLGQATVSRLQNFNPNPWCYEGRTYVSNRSFPFTPHLLATVTVDSLWLNSFGSQFSSLLPHCKV